MYVSKSLLLVSAMLLFQHLAKAQYFQRFYGNYATTGNGMITQSTGPGHLIAGIKPANMINLSNPSPTIVRTNINGAFSSALHFNNTYSILDPNTGNLIDFTANEALEFSNGSGYASIGSYTAPGAAPGNTIYGLCYMRLNTTGNVLITQGYNIGLPAPHIPNFISLNSITESTSIPGVLYACGQITSTAGESFIFVLCVSQNGSLLWGQLYNFTYSASTFEGANDVLENPFNGSELLVVGASSTDLNQATDDGFIMNLNTGTGNVNWVNFYDQGNGSAERFTAITHSQDPLQPGFMLCGEIEFNSNTAWQENKPFLNKFTQNLNPNWSRSYTYFTSPRNNNAYATDVKGRMSTSGVYEYFVTGMCDHVTPDVMVFKTDAGGVIYPLGWVSYDPGGISLEIGQSIDVNTSGTANGLSIYAYQNDLQNLQTKMYLVKAYFNGESGCNQFFENYFYGGLTPGITSPGVTTYTFGTCPLSLNQQTSNANQLLCFNVSIPTGNNSRSAPVENGDLFEKESGIRVSPNPLQASIEKKMQVQTESFTEEPVKLSLVDFTGRIVLQKWAQVQPGTNNIELELEQLNLAAGIYTLIYEQATETRSTRISVGR